MRRSRNTFWALALALVTSGATLLFAQSTQETNPADEVRENSHLRAKIEPLLPEGTDPVAAAEGFKKLDQFVASANVSKNLEIVFDRLKSEMLGPAEGELDKAIHSLKPDLSHAEVAEHVARANSMAREQIDAAMEEQRAANEQRKEAEEQDERPVPGRP